jgi:hypothetical protein
VSRKFNRTYAHTNMEIIDEMGQRLCQHEAISGVFSPALGDYGYLVRSPELPEIMEMVQYIQATTD